MAQRSKARDCIEPREWSGSTCAFTSLTISRGQTCSRAAPRNISPSQRGRSQLSNRPALTLIELLLTLAVLGILAGVLIPHLSGDLPERLSAGAQVISADLDYARSLAVTNNTSYQLTFDVTNNQYDLRHTGTNTLFNALPRSPYRQSNDPVDRQTTKLSQLPLPAPGVMLSTVLQMAGTPQPATTIEFNALGGTTCASQSAIWLSSGQGNVKRYCSILIDPVTGLVSIGPTVTALPSAVSAVATSQTATAVADTNVQVSGS